MKHSFEHCPICGGQLAVRRVEKLLRGGNDTATVKVKADVCRQCGERFYTQEVVACFEEICAKLQRHETAGLIPIGRLFEAKAG